MFDGSLKNRYLIENFRDSQGNWFKKYSDGWIEQGAFNNGSGTWGKKTISLLKPFANENYTVLFNVDTSDLSNFSDSGSTSIRVNYSQTALANKTTTGFTVGTYYYFRWYACGQGA